MRYVMVDRITSLKKGESISGIKCPATVMQCDFSQEKELNRFIEKMKEMNASRAFGKPDDVANAVKFSAGNGSRFINGKTLQVDGGFIAGV